MCKPLSPENKELFTKFLQDILVQLDKTYMHIVDFYKEFTHNTPPAFIVVGDDELYYFSESNEYVEQVLLREYCLYVKELNETYIFLPYLSEKTMRLLIKKKINPPVLLTLLYYLPIIAYIPFVTANHFFYKYLELKAHSYLITTDKAFNIFGKILFMLLKENKKKSYRDILNNCLLTIIKYMKRRGFDILVDKKILYYNGVKLNIVILTIMISR